MTDHTDKLSEQQLTLAVLGSKMDEMLRRMDKMEDSLEKIEQNSVRREEHHELKQIVGRLLEDVHMLKAQRWILGGAAVAGGGSGIGALAKMFLGG